MPFYFRLDKPTRIKIPQKGSRTAHIQVPLMLNARRGQRAVTAQRYLWEEKRTERQSDLAAYIAKF